MPEPQHIDCISYFEIRFVFGANKSVDVLKSSDPKVELRLRQIQGGSVGAAHQVAGAEDVRYAQLRPFSGGGVADDQDGFEYGQHGADVDVAVGGCQQVAVAVETDA